MTQVIYAIVGILLLMMSVQDIKACKISNGYILVIAMVCGIGGCFFEKLSWIEMLSGCSVGFGLLGISVLTREQIGAGDGFVMAAIGLLVGAMKALTILSAASLMMAAVSVILIIIKRGTRNMRLPFLPAISIGYMLCMAR